MVVAVIISVIFFAYFQEQKYTLFFEKGIVTLRINADLSQNSLEAIQTEIEEAIANKAMTAKEIKIAVKKIIKAETETNNFSYSADFGSEKNEICISVLKPIETIGVWIFCIGSIFCSLSLLYIFWQMLFQ